MSIIYKTTNQLNGKYYVGKHFTSADDGYLGSGLLLDKSIKKYGKENFIRETIELCTSANVDEREVYWIDKLSATDRNIGYNISKGGTGGNNIIWTEKRRKEFSENQKGKFSGNKNPRYGIKLSEETKNKIRINAKGRKFSKETKKLLSEIRRGKHNPFFWQKAF